MTDVNFNSKRFNSDQISDVNSSQCILSYSQFCEIEKLAALYQSLEFLLRSFHLDGLSFQQKIE